MGDRTSQSRAYPLVHSYVVYSYVVRSYCFEQFGQLQPSLA